MSEQPRAASNDGGEELRRLLASRITQLFGAERAAANAGDIEVVAAAIERVRRMRPPDFAGLDPEERD